MMRTRRKVRRDEENKEFFENVVSSGFDLTQNISCLYVCLKIEDRLVSQSVGRSVGLSFSMTCLFVCFVRF